MADKTFEKEYGLKLGEIYNGEGRSRVESEVILPDYKEEASRIIRVDAKVQIQNKNTYIQGQSVICETEGVLSFDILYQSNRQGDMIVPSSFLAGENFSYRFQLPLPKEEFEPDSLLSFLEAEPEHISAKLLGPRKIAVRGDAVLALSLKCNRRFPYYSGQFPQDIQTKAGNLISAQLVSVHQEELSFTETIRLPKAYLPIGELCQMDATLFAQNVHCEDGGIAFMGQCALNGGYVAKEEDSFISFFQPIEFEKRVGIPTCEKTDYCQVCMTANLLKASTEVNEEGENKNILFEVGYTLEVYVYRNESLSVCLDAFSTKTKLQCEKTMQSAERLVGMSDFAVTVRDQIPLEEEPLRIEGIRSVAVFRDSYWEEGKIVLEGKLNFRYLAVNSEGHIQNRDGSYDFRCTLLPDGGIVLPEGEECRIEIAGGVKALDLEADGQQLRVRFDLCGNVTVFAMKRISCLSSVEQGEAYSDNKKGILFVYPEKDEELWDLCSRCRVSPEQVKKENGMEDDILPGLVRITK